MLQFDLKNWLGSHKFLKPALLCLAVMVVLAIALIFLFPGGDSFNLEYKVKPFSTEAKILQVNLRITPVTHGWFSGTKTFSLMGPAVGEYRCVDNSNRTVNLQNKEGIIKIGPIADNVQYVDFSYQVQIGFPGKLGSVGALYDDLMVFSGDNVFLFPYIASEKELDKIGSLIHQISIQVDTKEGWTSILPYQANYNVIQKDPVVIKNPDWMTFFNLGKSCYAFGKFEPLTLKRKLGDINILIDPGYKADYSKEVEDSIGALYDYYAGVFGEGLNNYPVILLRKDPVTKGNIIGGISGQTLGLTLSPDQGYNWQSFSHSLYSAFFDSKVKARNLHFSPNTWFYKGLATYYETLSMDALPETVKTKFEYDANAGYRDLYIRYLYFRLKEPALFTIAPMDDNNFAGGQSEFMYYTQAPLIIGAIEKSPSKPDKNRSLLQYVLKHSKDQAINVNEAIKEILGPFAKDFSTKYVNGKELLPFFGSGDTMENPTKVVKKLNDFEYIMFTWFRAAGIQDPFDQITILRPENVIEETNRRGLTFASRELEDTIRGLSPTLFVLLRQHVLRADVCGEKNLNDPKLKVKLCGNLENLTKWQDFLKDFLVKCANDQKKQEQKSK
jgi:hypothetical protein